MNAQPPKLPLSADQAMPVMALDLCLYTMGGCVNQLNFMKHQGAKGVDELAATLLKAIEEIDKAKQQYMKMCAGQVVLARANALPGLR